MWLLALYLVVFSTVPLPPLFDTTRDPSIPSFFPLPQTSLFSSSSLFLVIITSPTFLLSKWNRGGEGALKEEEERETYVVY